MILRLHTFQALCFVGFLLATTCSEARRPNVILVMADDMGFEALRCNGGSSYDSELLDQLAADGMRFTHCYSQPICTPSRNKIMTGRSNARNYRSFGLLLPDEITFGNVMKSAGYKTCVAGKWQLTGGGKGGATPRSCGFDRSCMWAYKHNLPPGVEHTGGWEKQNVTSRFWHPSIIEDGEYRPTEPQDYGPDIYTQFIIDFLKRNKDQECFVYFPMTLTHGPFLPTPHSKDLASAEKFLSKPKYFGDMIAYTGHCVQRIIRTLDDLGIAENTLLLFTTDNGTHRSLVSQSDGRRIPGGKGLALDAGCHVPMIAYWKGTVRPATVCSDLIDFSDFLPTIADLGDAPVPADRELDGRSFLPQLTGEKGNPRSSVFVHYDKAPHDETPEFRRVRFAYNGRYKLYHDGKLFDVPHDWEEDDPIDIALATPQVVRIHAKLQAALAAMPAWEPDNSTFNDGDDAPTKAWRRKARSQAAND